MGYLLAWQANGANVQVRSGSNNFYYITISLIKKEVYMDFLINVY